MIEKILKSVVLPLITVGVIGCSSQTNLLDYKTKLTPIDPSLIEFVQQKTNNEMIGKSFDYSKYTANEILKKVQTPCVAQDYVTRHYKPDENDTHESFYENHIDRKGNCFDYMVGVAALLKDNGYPSLMLGMLSDKGYGHSVYLCKTEEGFIALGQTPILKPSKNIENLLKKFVEKYNFDVEKYFIADLDEIFPDDKWIHGKNNFKNITLDFEWIKLPKF